VKDGDPELESLLADLRATVALRRARGEFPEGLEEELDQHFRRIAAARPVRTSLDPLRAQIDALLSASRFSAARIPTDSASPGGAALHRSLARVFARQAEGILQQVQEFADRTREALTGVADLLADANTHVHEELAGLVDAHTELLTGRERFPSEPSERLDDLAGRVERLERARAADQWRPWFSREQFERAFRDDQDQTVEAAVAEVLVGSPSVLVIAPDSLAARLGQSAWRLPAGQDPVEALGAVPSGEADHIVLLRADAHVGPTQLIRLVALAAEKLHDAGRLIVSWREPQEGSVVLRYDPTLPPPLPAEYLAFACREAGFSDVNVEAQAGATKLIVATL
jgi:hypothetical protein